MPLQHCTCPAGHELSCPDNGTAPGCILLPVIPQPSRAFGPVGVLVALLVITLAAVLLNRQWTADLCRLCLGAGSPLGKLRPRQHASQCDMGTLSVSTEPLSQ